VSSPGAPSNTRCTRRPLTHAGAAAGERWPLDGPPWKGLDGPGSLNQESASRSGFAARDLAANGDGKSMLIGAHSIIYSTNPDVDRAFLRNVLMLPNVDVGEGWLIFGLPPAEVAVHPSDKNDVHEFYLMCDDVDSFITQMKTHNVVCSPVQNQGWGLLTEVTLPGGGKLGIYQPRHARPKVSAGRATKKATRRATTTPVRARDRKTSKKKSKRH
jgi:hypothetical protein